VTETGSLEARLARVAAQAPGRIGVAVHDDQGWTWTRDAYRVTRSASTIKVPILLAALRQVEAGRLDLRDDVAIAAFEQRVGGSGALSLLPSVTSLSLLEALRLMIALSDNDATNAVLDHAGLLASVEVDRLLADVPTRHTRLRRRMMDPAAVAAGQENETCPQDLLDLLVALQEGRLLGAEMTTTARTILRQQQLVAGLPAYVPADVLVGSKTGDLPGLRADLALMERGDRWVAVAVVADELGDPGRRRRPDRGTATLPVFASLGELVAERLDPLAERP
jgi:beta-lactamase class A